MCSAAINKATNEEIAIKKIGNAFDNRIDAKRTLREIKLLRHLDHENVCRVHTSRSLFLMLVDCFHVYLVLFEFVLLRLLLSRT